MAHLGDDVAAYVDGQLPSTQHDAARRHLAECERCRRAVADQEQLKRRMASGSVPPIPSTLAASLAALASHPPADPPRSRWRDHRAVQSVVVLVGASMAVLWVAYAVAPDVPRDGDPVAPDVSAFAAEFVEVAAAERSPGVATQASFSTPGQHRELSATRMDELDASGWPCHPMLAGDLQRLAGKLIEPDDVVALHYGDGSVRLHLHEQSGSLDTGSLEGFHAANLGGAAVWVRNGMPRMVTWDAEGIVYTIVSDASTARIADVIGELPRSQSRSEWARIDAGLERMSGWLSVS